MFLKHHAIKDLRVMELQRMRVFLIVSTRWI
jgi:hypothetical protein